MSAFFLRHPKETDLALFAGGESGPFARWRIERHVESCPHCQDIAADFFRLPEQLNELADLPSVDWKQMAMTIESGVRADAEAGVPADRAGFPPLIWQAGWAAATVVVGVIVVQQFNQEQLGRELIATAKIEAPASQVAEQQETDEAEPARREIATAQPARSAPVIAETEVPLAKVREDRQQSLASDIAAPAAPPPPPAVLNETVSRRAAVVSEPIATAAESAEARLRSDAASRVGTVAAFGSAAPAAADQAAGLGQTRVAWAQLPVEAVNFADAPVRLSGGSTAFAGAIVKTPSVATTNGSDRTVTGLKLVWIVGDAEASATALIERGIEIVPGAATSSGGDRSWQLPAGIVSAKMRIYLTSVSFDDGSTWSPSAEQIAGLGLMGPGVEYPQLELLPATYELDERP